MAGAVAADARRLPALREDLRLLPGAAAVDGSPTWTLHDPARHRFFRIGWMEFEILSRWAIGVPGRIAASVAADTTLRASESDVEAMARFANSAGLLAPAGEAGTRRLAAEAASRRLGAGMWLLKNYLFLRLRLIDPDRLLGALLRWLGWLYSRGFAIGVGAAGLLALHLVGRQWDAYVHNFSWLFSLEGAAMAALAMGGAKVVHEFGHGLTAKRYGCRVPAMGVALLVLWPVLWTDTTDAWRLRERRRRVAIDAAGMAAEIVLAVAATLAWAVLPDGPARSAAFLLSSTTWVLTVAVNVNPLMRFDGYYILSDSLGVPNLQDRGFALATWRLRRVFLGSAEAPPERLPPRTERIVLAYAYATLVYRFFLFMGIAVLVYHIAFKALGLFLMAVEIWWFIARPIVGELRVWWRTARGGGMNRPTALTLAGFAALIGALAFPWRGTVEAPALRRADREAALLAAEPGRLVSVAESGTRVAAGDVVARMDSPTLESRRAAVRAAIAALRYRIEGQAFDPKAAEAIEVSWQQLGRALAELRSLDAELDALTVRAPFAGVVRDVPFHLRGGEWLPRRERLGLLIDDSALTVEAYVAEGDLGRVAVGARARFYPENGDPPGEWRVAALAPVSTRVLEAPDLSHLLPVRRDPQGAWLPTEAFYKVTLAPADARAGAAARRVPGHVAIKGAPGGGVGDPRDGFVVRRAARSRDRRPSPRSALRASG
jgi:putative peptide zinc metalloprotease protein